MKKQILFRVNTQKNANTLLAFFNKQLPMEMQEAVNNKDVESILIKKEAKFSEVVLITSENKIDEEDKVFIKKIGGNISTFKGHDTLSWLKNQGYVEVI
jgi:hypothetical protein